MITRFLSLSSLHLGHQEPSHQTARISLLLLSALVGTIVLPATMPSAQAQGIPESNDAVALTPFQVNASKDSGLISRNAVSATRFNVPIENLPFTINVISRQLLDDAEVLDLRDAVKYAGNVFSSGNGAFTHTTTNVFRIRGFETPFNLRNGFRASGTIAIMPVSVERVEVVKGPASLLYGQIPPGGVVNIITKRPKQKAEDSVKVQVGSFDFYRAELDSTGPLGRGFSYRLLSGYENSKTDMAFQRRDQFSINPMLDWQSPGGRLTLHSELFYHTVHDVAKPTDLPIDTDLTKRVTMPDGNIGVLFPSYWPIRDYNARDENSFSNSIIKGVYEEANLKILNFLNARAAVNFQQYREQAINEANGTNVNISLAPGSAGYGATPSASFDKAANSSEDLDTQFNLLADFDTKFLKGSVLVGVDYAHRKSKNYLARAGEPNPTNPAQIIPYTRTKNYYDRSTWTLQAPIEKNYQLISEGGYGSLRANTRNSSDVVSGYVSASLAALDERVHATYGIRSDKFESSSLNYATTPATPQESSGNWVTQQGGLLLKILREKKNLPDVSVYGNVSESFEPVLSLLKGPDPDGQVLDLDTNGDGVADTPNLADNPTFTPKPVVGKGHEVGIKASLFGGRAILSVARFQVEYTNIVRNIVVNAPVTNQRLDEYQIQSGLERSNGYEVELMADVTPNWQIQAAYTQIEAKLRSDAQNPTAVGRDLPDTPPHSLRLFTRYQFRDGALKGLSFGTGIDWTDLFFGSGAAQDVNPNTHREFPERTVVEAFAGYDFKLRRFRYHAQLNVKNLTDVYGGEVGRFGGTMKPRNFVLSVGTRF